MHACEQADVCDTKTHAFRARKIACPTSRGNKKFQSGNCNFFTYVPVGNHAFIRYLAGPGFSINIFVGKMGKINKWQQGMVKLSAEGICLLLGRQKMCPGYSTVKKTFHLLCEIRKLPSKNSSSPRCLMVGP